MSNLRNSFFWVIFLALIILGVIFVGHNYLLAAGDPPSHNGVIEDNPDWQYQNCASTTDEYLILKTVTSTLISPDLNFSDCVSSTMNFELKAYRGLTSKASSSLLTIEVYSSSAWLELASYYATSTVLSFQTPLDLSIYCGRIVKLKFSSPNATGYYGIGLDNISFKTVDKQSSSTDDITTSTLVINPNDLVINEIYPAPLTGQDEWIELYNNTTSTIDLSGFYLLNLTSGNFVTTTLTGTIGPNEYFVIEESDIVGSLNNDGDTVVLRTLDQIISQTTYGNFPESRKGDSWARKDDGNYAITIMVTKGELNIIEDHPVENNNSSATYLAPKAEEIIATTTATTTFATSTLEKYLGKIIINEIYPNPPGSDTEDEFIELKNISTESIDLTGLVIGDASKNKYLIRASTTASTTNILATSSYAVFKRSKTNLALNNTGVESVKLMASNLEIIDLVEYVGENEEGVSYSLNCADKWQWVKTPTPGADNADDALYVDEENSAIIGEQKTVKTTAKSTVKKSTTYQLATLTQLREFSSGDLVKVRGVVSVIPGVLGSQYFYIAGSGVQIYSNKKDFPELNIGDYIEVFGELSDTSSGRRIKTATRNQIKFIEHQADPEPHILLTSEVGEEYEGYLAKLSGDILEISGRNYIIDDGSGEAKIYFNSKVNLKDINGKSGDKITVIGIIGQTATGYRVMPRDLKDIVITPGKVQGEFVKAEPKAVVNSTNYYFIALIIFLSAVIVMLYFKLKNPPD